MTCTIFTFLSLPRNPCVTAGSTDCLLWRTLWCQNDTLMKNCLKSTAGTMMMLMYVLYFHWLKLIFFSSFYSLVEMKFHHYFHWSKLSLMIIFMAHNQVPSLIFLYIKLKGPCHKPALFMVNTVIISQWLFRE